MSNANRVNHFNEDKYNLYKSRVIVYCVFLALALIICIFLGFNVVKKVEITPISYCDSGLVDYRVYLKENEFYTESFLPKGKSYITSLIDYIDINYNYVFNIDDLTSIDFEYKVMGDLIIENNTNKKELFSKEYEITETKTNKINGTNELAFNEKFQIDYSKYNTLANEFRSSYGVDTNSYLKVYLSMKRTTVEDSKYKLESTNIDLNEVIIPLSEKAIEINIDSNNNKTCNQVTFNVDDNINYINIVIILLLILLSIFFIRVIFKSYKKMKRRRSEYDRYVNKILKEYDRLVVEIKTLIDFRKYNIIKVETFTELLDVRDNLKVPINYYCYIKHIKGIFYVKADNDIYALFISDELLEKDN
ncbi:MAG: hypothetical protein IJ572_03275 [Bacilli bacterium]|nr:hypothetical protein [Bacilli bacterium]